MGYANSHRSSMKGGRPQRVAINNGGVLKCPSFLDLMSGEKIIRIAHPTWLNYLLLLVFGAVCLLSALALFCFVKDVAAIVPALILSSLGVLLPVYVTITVLSTVAVITNCRVITKTGFISTRMSEVRIADIRGISRSRGIWQAIVGVSNLGIGTAATGETEIEIVGIRNANEMIALINSLRPSV